jgi:hypothetical protein
MSLRQSCNNKSGSKSPNISPGFWSGFYSFPNYFIMPIIEFNVYKKSGKSFFPAVPHVSRLARLSLPRATVSLLARCAAAFAALCVMPLPLGATYSAPSARPEHRRCDASFKAVSHPTT